MKNDKRAKKKTKKKKKRNLPAPHVDNKQPMSMTI